MLIKTIIIITLAALFTNDTEDEFIASGWLSSYHPQRSIATLNYRYEIGDIEPGADAYVAVADCSLIGKKGTLTYEDGPILNVQVFDCAGRDGVDENGVALITKAGIIAELDSDSAELYGLGRATITIRRNDEDKEFCRSDRCRWLSNGRKSVLYRQW